MKMIKCLALLIFCYCAVFAFCGCKHHMDDGPGMEYMPGWSEFEVSRTDSFAQYNFYFRVIDGEHPSMIGECVSENGENYSEENGIELSDETIWELYRLNLEQLETFSPEEYAEIFGDEEAQILLDDSGISLSITLPDGTVEEKNISSDLSLRIYEILLPYFKK